MRGVVLFGLSSVSFAGFLFLLFGSGNYASFWMSLEVLTLCVVPLFFLGSGGSVFLSLFTYVIICGLASGLIVGGLLCDSVSFYVYVGLMCKFGVFPFMGWMYQVFVNSNWWVIWGVSTILKASFLYFYYCLGLGSSPLWLLSLFCAITLLFLSVLFWAFTFSWEYYWCHSAISSSAVFVSMISSGLDFSMLSGLFLVYVFWVSLSLILISQFEFYGSFSCVSYFLFAGVLVSFPLSLAVVYKCAVGGLLLSCSILVCISWVVCSVSEQCYLLKYLFSISSSFGGWGGATRV